MFSRAWSHLTGATKQTEHTLCDRILRWMKQNMGGGWKEHELLACSSKFLRPLYFFFFHAIVDIICWNLFGCFGGISGTFGGLQIKPEIKNKIKLGFWLNTDLKCFEVHSRGDPSPGETLLDRNFIEPLGGIKSIAKSWLNYRWVVVALALTVAEN